MSLNKEKEKVLEAWRHGSKALQDQNWKNYLDYWAHTDYVELIHPKEKEWLRGWKSIGSGYRQFIRQEPVIELEYSNVSIHVSQHADMAWLSCKASMKLTLDNSYEIESWQTNIFEKIDGKWKLVHGHASNFY